MNETIFLRLAITCLILEVLWQAVSYTSICIMTPHICFEADKADNLTVLDVYLRRGYLLITEHWIS